MAKEVAVDCDRGPFDLGGLCGDPVGLDVVCLAPRSAFPKKNDVRDNGRALALEGIRRYANCPYKLGS